MLVHNIKHMLKDRKQMKFQFTARQGDLKGRNPSTNYGYINRSSRSSKIIIRFIWKRYIPLLFYTHTVDWRISFFDENVFFMEKKRLTE